MDLTGFAFFLTIGAIGASLLLGPVGKAISRRIGGREPSASDPEAAERIAELEHRLVDLEERLDFAERLLAQERATERLPGGKE